MADDPAMQIQTEMTECWEPWARAMATATQCRLYSVSMDDLPPDLDELRRSMQRLRAAGIVASYSLGTELGHVTWTDDYLQLLLADRDPAQHPEFQQLWAHGDPELVRTWIEREAAAVRRRGSQS